MAATYDPTDLDTGTASGRVNVVRLLLHDNVMKTPPTVAYPEYSNEEISWFLSECGGGVYDGALLAARAAVSKYARLSVNRRVGDLNLDTSDRAEQWRAAVASLEKLRAERSPGLAPLVGHDLTSTDYVPTFSLGMDDYPGTNEAGSK
jgi:hypothetical protein